MDAITAFRTGATKRNFSVHGVDAYGKAAGCLGRTTSCKGITKLARLAGFEPTTPGFGGQYSIH